jgi:uncharacterized iron-regulated membrane protein
MSIPARAEAAVKGLALWAGLGMAVLATCLAGLGFLIAGFFLWVHRYKSDDIAAAITGGVLLALAIAIALTGQLVLKRIKRRQPPLISEFTGIIVTAGRIAGLLIRKDPRKSMIIAVIAGAVAEYITSGDKRKK